MRGDKPRNRPGWSQLPLTFVAYQEGTAYAQTAAQVQTAFEDGLFQRAGTYIWNDFATILASIGGRIYAIDCSAWNVTDITIPGDPNPAIRPRAWFEQGEMFSFIQDGQSKPLIFDGSGLRRSDVTNKEIPTGTLMKYALGRMTVVLPDGRSFLVGNIVGSTFSGSLFYNFRDSIIKFDENDYLDGGGVFSAPREITALAEVATLDTTLAQGPVQIFTTSGAYSANYPFDRAEWLTVTYPLITGSLLSRGSLSQEATVNVNNDVWYRSSDGLRSLRIARRNFEGWGDTPLSHEIERILKYDTPSLLPYASGTLFDNRLFMTCSPQFVPDHGVIHRGLVPLDFDESSSIARDGIPAYDGLWTGLRILQILTIEINSIPRCFAFALDTNDKIVLYELSLANPSDNYGTPQETRIPWLVEYARFDWGERGVAQHRFKKLIGGEVCVSNLNGSSDAGGQIDFTIRYRADSYPVWSDWASWTECADRVCAPIFCEEPNQLQARVPMRLPDPPEVCEAYVGVNSGKGTPKLTKYGFAFQARVEVIGSAQLESLRLTAIDLPEPLYDACRTTEPCLTLQACNSAIFGYEIA